MNALQTTYYKDYEGDQHKIIANHMYSIIDWTMILLSFNFCFVKVEVRTRNNPTLP